MELYEKGKNISLVSDTVQEVKDEIIEALDNEDVDIEDTIDVIEIKASARLRNLVPMVINRQDKYFPAFCNIHGPTDARSCYYTPQILISDFINFRENQK